MKSIEGIILKNSPRREADAVFTLYTKEHGLMELQAKSVRKHSGKLRHGLDMFNHTEVFFVPSKYMPIITDFKIKDSNLILKNDLYRLKLAHIVAQIIFRIFEPGMGEAKVWEKTSDFFSILNNKHATREGLKESAYLWCYYILDSNGLNPRAPDFKLEDSAILRVRIKDLFLHNFGVSLDKLI